MAVLGLAMATDAGASFDLVPVLIGVLAVALAIGSLFVYERPLHWVVSAGLRASVAVTGRPRGDTPEQIARLMSWMIAVRLSWTQTARIVGWGSVNWLLDCACFAMMFPAIHAPVPWAGLLLAYGAGQLAATLPITPGGLGVVEGSITVALVAFGGAETSTAYAVLLYRIISFWFILLLGWTLIGEMALEVRRGRWTRSAMASAVEAGPVAYGPGGRRCCGCCGWGGGVGGFRRTVGGGGIGDMTRSGRGWWRLFGAWVAGLALAAAVLAGCSSARTGLGTTDESCYLALPTASKAVGGHAHLEGIRKYSISGLKSVAPMLYDALADQVPKGQAVCIAGYTGHFTASEVTKAMGRPTGTLAVVVVTRPGNKLLGTLILSKLPVRFQHTHPF